MIRNTLFSLRRRNFQPAFRCWFSDLKGPQIPDDFYDPETEVDKEFLDIAAVVHTGGIGKIANSRANISWNSVYSSEWQQTTSTDGNGSILTHQPHESVRNYLSHPSSFSDNETHFEDASFGDDSVVEEPDEHPLSEFLSDSSPINYTPETQGNRPCPGKRQRRGINGKLMCHKIDLQQLHYLNILSLSSYLSPQSEILGRESTGLCAKCQRKVASSIKKARNYGLLTHLGNTTIRNVDPDVLDPKSFHKCSIPVRLSTTVK